MMQNGNTYSSAALCSAIKIPKMVCTLIPAASLSASENIHDQSPEQKNVTWHTTVGVMVHVWNYPPNLHIGRDPPSHSVSSYEKSSVTQSRRQSSSGMRLKYCLYQHRKVQLYGAQLVSCWVKMLSGVMNVRAVFDFTDAEYFLFVATGLCTFYNRVCPGDIIVT